MPAGCGRLSSGAPARAGLERGLSHLAADEPDAAARELRAVVEVIPDDPVALDYLARASQACRARLLGHEGLTPG